MLRAINRYSLKSARQKKSLFLHRTTLITSLSLVRKHIFRPKKRVRETLRRSLSLSPINIMAAFVDEKNGNMRSLARSLSFPFSPGSLITFHGAVLPDELWSALCKDVVSLFILCTKHFLLFLSVNIFR